jgi:hypothetical protein
MQQVNDAAFQMLQRVQRCVLCGVPHTSSSPPPSSPIFSLAYAPLRPQLDSKQVFEISFEYEKRHQNFAWCVKGSLQVC